MPSLVALPPAGEARPVSARGSARDRPRAGRFYFGTSLVLIFGGNHIRFSMHRLLHCARSARTTAAGTAQRLTSRACCLSLSVLGNFFVPEVTVAVRHCACGIRELRVHTQPVVQFENLFFCFVFVRPVAFWSMTDFAAVRWPRIVSECAICSSWNVVC